jgi:diguanylate cyclase (GGDEF)-like protein/PAS domain S-box-containing protein
MIHPTHRRDAFQAGMPVVMSFLAILLLWASPVPAAIKGWANYLPLHMALETASIFFAGMIFSITWHTPRAQNSLRNVIVGCIFGGVALLDFSHMLSYAGMPSFVTPSGSSKAIYFWLAARIFACLGLLTIAFTKEGQPATQRHALSALVAVLATVALAHVMIFFNFEKLPQVFIEGQGLTAWKIQVEYALVCAYLLPALFLAKKLTTPRSNNVSGLIAAAALMAMSEFTLTLYADVTDLYNLAGHILKVAAYFYLYRPLFVESLQAPYQRLRDALAELEATLQALPDLLFELDENGKFLSAHTGNIDQLLMPASEFLGKTMLEVLPSSAAQIGMEAIQEAKEHGVSHGKIYEIDLHNQRSFYELSVARKANTHNGQNHYIFITRDVSKRVRNEMTLRQEARFNADLVALSLEEETTSADKRLQKTLSSVVALTESQVGFMALTAPNGLVSPHVLSRNGHEPIIETISNWHLQENDIWSKSIRERRPVTFNQAEDLPTLTGLPAQLGAIHHWIALPIFDDNKLVMLVGIGNKATPYIDSDIEFLHLMAYGTWQIVHKQQINKALHRFSLATSQNPNPVIITDLSARIEYVNEAFTRTSGYSAAEVIGRNPRILQSGKTPRNIYQDMWSKLRSEQPWKGELINRTKEGVEYYEEALIYPIRNEAGVVTHYLAHKQDIGDKRIAAERIQYLSEFDQLTGLPNRTLLMEQLQFELAQAKSEVKPMALLWLNLDLFKDINNTFGHATGDSVLREAAHRMRGIMQGRDIMARYSGDNFVFARADTDQYGAIRMVNQLLSVLSHPIELQGEELVLTASIGLALYPNDAVSATDLMRCAETAMFRVKHESRNSYSFYSPDMQKSTARAFQLTNAFKMALARQELRLVYQPQVSLLDGHVTGAEALIRWSHPQLGDISPTEFIPLVENAGLGTLLGEWVLESVLTNLHEWHNTGVPLVKIAVNLSAVQFVEAGLTEKVRLLLKKSSVSTEWIEFELTEVAAMKNPEQAAHTMSELSALGLTLSIDDFGTGYSSLSQLKRFKVYKLKIDQSFIRDIVDDLEDQAIVDAIINMAHSLGMITIAEGVETPAQLAFLKSHHCDEIQGYLYSHPLEVADFEQLLRSPPRFELPSP